MFSFFLKSCAWHAVFHRFRVMGSFENNLYVFLDEITKIFLFPFTECEIDSIAWSDDSLFLAIGER